MYSWSIVNNFVIDVYCRCLEILCQIAFSSVANYFGSYGKKQFGTKSTEDINNKVVNYRISSHIIKQCGFEPATFECGFKDTKKYRIRVSVLFGVCTKKLMNMKMRKMKNEKVCYKV